MKPPQEKLLWSFLGRPAVPPGGMGAGTRDVRGVFSVVNVTVENPQKKVSIVDIARLSGVSIAAVSAVLNDRPNVCQATRDRVKEIIRRYQYVPRSAARALSSKRTYQIGFLLSCKVTLGLSNNYFSTMLSGVYDVCRKRKYNVTVATYDMTNIRDFIIPTTIRQHDLDGVIIAGIADLQILREIQRTNLPFLTIEGDYPEDILCVKNDDAVVFSNVLSFFYDLGHRKLAVPFFYPETKRVYLDAQARGLAEGRLADLELEYYRYRGDDFACGSELADAWLETDRRTRFSAIVGSDQYCAGFLGRIIRRGARCPEDISILATETSLSRYCTIPMTTCDANVFGLGQEAATHLLNLIEKKNSVNKIKSLLRSNRFSGRIIIRDSTAPYLPLAEAAR